MKNIQEQEMAVMRHQSNSFKKERCIEQGEINLEVRNHFDAPPKIHARIFQNFSIDSFLTFSIQILLFILET